ncbi:hypothetical protein BU24DRAFT_423639 [Aaosphaeria arxii CBS 175.79]|uniref:Fucose-specific lectin n=1 Tax=Aaosphaeria arxii CBS 175.79 TaxID=1450172 RepID=A0A6A5XPP4_9PLEO|nr:uncharacterized protein BU24DRAFT_423639 [Aaosphaeria arxii CBS 175.79]KAF2014731.1 hypothetical protein BU24DRAFT_423639 [Aaosphaeria arxii CBS 175.79]
MAGSSDLYVENGSSAHDSLTALPSWDEIQTRPRTALSSLQSPKKAHTRPRSKLRSADVVFEKPELEKDTERGIANDRSGASTPAADKDKPRHSRMMVWLVLIVVIVLALAVVLGAVLGTFVSPGGASNSPQPSVTEIPAGASPSPTPTSTPGGASPVPTFPPHLESIGASGWSVPGEAGYYVVWLVTQNTEGYLNRHTFNSSTGNWTRISNFAKAKQGTPLGVASLRSKYYDGEPNYKFPGVDYQTSVVYLNDNNYLLEWIFPDSGPVEGQPGPLTEQKYMAHEASKLAYYWPTLSYQGLSGEIRQAYYECHRKNECWHDRVLDTNEAKNGTQLAMSPMQNELTVAGLFYQEKDGGRVVIYREDNGNGTAELWSNDAFSSSVPRDSSLSAFSTVRIGLRDESKLNTYLLWQNDANNTVQMSWTDNEGEWTGPRSFQAFASADNNTAMACLTGLTFPKSHSHLPAGTELSRCYFQSGAAVREVSFDGAGWDVVGNVPVEF